MMRRRGRSGALRWMLQPGECVAIGGESGAGNGRDEFGDWVSSADGGAIYLDGKEMEYAGFQDYRRKHLAQQSRSRFIFFRGRFMTISRMVGCGVS